MPVSLKIIQLTVLAVFLFCGSMSPASAQSSAAAPVPATGMAAAQAPAQPSNVPRVLTPGSEPIKLPEGYAYPATLENIIKAALRFKLLDTDNDLVIDDFAKVTYCSVYTRDHFDEFVWRKVRLALRQKIQDESDRYPTLIYLNRREAFGQYNFNDTMLLLKPSSVMRGVNMLQVIPVEQRTACGVPLEAITQNFIAALDKDLTIDGVKLNETEAKAVVSGLEQTGNESSFNTVAGVKISTASDADPQNDVTRLGFGRYVIDLTGSSEAPLGYKNSIVMAAHVESITFFEDAYYQKPFWRGLTSVRDYTENTSLAKEIQFHGIMDEPDTQQSPSDAPVSPVH